MNRKKLLLAGSHAGSTAIAIIEEISGLEFSQTDFKPKTKETLCDEN